MVQNNGTMPFKDECVIYYSAEDASWIAHGLHTDQIGFGNCVVDAAVDLMIRLRNLFELAQKEGNIQLFIEAPGEIKDLCKNAKQLTPAIQEIIRERFYNECSSEWPVRVEVPKSEIVTTSLQVEEVAA